MSVLILVEIFLWNIFEATTLIADEYSAYGLATIIFLGSGYCLKEKGHIRITLVLTTDDYANHQKLIAKNSM